MASLDEKNAIAKHQGNRHILDLGLQNRLLSPFFLTDDGESKDCLVLVGRRALFLLPLRSGSKAGRAQQGIFPRGRHIPLLCYNDCALLYE